MQEIRIMANKTHTHTLRVTEEASRFILLQRFEIYLSHIHVNNKYI